MLCSNPQAISLGQDEGVSWWCNWCNTRVFSKTGRCEHLTSESHQTLARKHCLETWGESRENGFCVVASSPFPLVTPTRVPGAVEGVAKFLDAFYRDYVADFVFWKELPELAIVYFAHRSNVLGTNSPSSGYIIDGQNVFMKPPENIPDDKWTSLFLKLRKIEKEKGNAIVPELSVLKMLRKGVREDIQVEDLFDPENYRKDEEKEEWATFSDNGWADLGPELNISRSPEEEEDAQVEQVQDALCLLFQTLDPNSRVLAYRSGRLRRLWNTGSELLFHVFSQHPDQGTTFYSDEVIKEVLNSPMGQALFLVASLPGSGVGARLIMKKSGVNFTLNYSSDTVVNAQLCRLLEYMITFDPRCFPLLSLFAQWIKLNNLIPSPDPDSTTPSSIRSTPIELGMLPETATLEWIVIHFFCYSKLIPTVREIQERAHEKIVEERFGMDVGFKADPEFVQEWKKKDELPSEEDYSKGKFVSYVLDTFVAFLNCYGTLLGKVGHIILNLREGNLMNRALFEFTGEKCAYQLYVLHPFTPSSRFLITPQLSSILKGMSRTAATLPMFLKELNIFLGGAKNMENFEEEPNWEFMKIALQITDVNEMKNMLSVFSWLN